MRSTTSRRRSPARVRMHVALARHVGDEDQTAPRRPGRPAPSTGSRRRVLAEQRRRRPALRAGRQHRCSGTRRNAARLWDGWPAAPRSGSGRSPPRRWCAASMRSPSTRRSGRGAPRSPAVEHELARSLAFHEHGVERPANRARGCVRGTMAGCTRTEISGTSGAGPRLERRSDDRQQLHHVAKPAGEGDVDGVHSGDPLAVARRQRPRHSRMPGWRGWPPWPRRRALDVRGGVTLGEPEALGLGQGLRRRRRPPPTSASG